MSEFTVTTPPVEETKEVPNYYNLTLRVFCLLIPIIGVIGNIIFLFYTRWNKIGSQVSLIFVRSQTISDLIVCLFSIGYNVQQGEYVYWLVKIEALDIIICYIWHGQYFYYFSMFCSTYILIMTSVDRFIAMVYPFVYRKRKPKQAYIALSVILGFGSIFELPILFSAIYIPGEGGAENGTCVYDTDYYFSPLYDRFLSIYGFLWSAFTFVIPVIIIVILYTTIIYSLRTQSTKMSETQETVKSASKLFTLAAFMIAACFIIFSSMESGFYILYNLGVIGYYYDTITDVVGVFLLSVNFCVNPIIYFSVFKRFREFVGNVIGCHWEQERILHCGTTTTSRETA